MTFKMGFPSSRPAKRPAPERRIQAYHAVSVRPGPDACDAAQAAKTTRVLSKDAPRLPLEDCDRPGRCACRYQHFEDRRNKPRRRAEGSPPEGAVLNVEDRRNTSGRRDEDYLDREDAEADTDPGLADTYYGYRRKPE